MSNEIDKPSSCSSAAGGCGSGCSTSCGGATPADVGEPQIAATRWLANADQGQIFKEVMMSQGERRSKAQVRYAVRTDPALASSGQDQERVARASYLGTTHHLMVLCVPPIGQKAERAHLTARSLRSNERRTALVRVEDLEGEATLFTVEAEEDVVELAALFERNEDLLFELDGPSGPIAKFPLPNNGGFGELRAQLLAA